jgi:hypothetical protein
MSSTIPHIELKKADQYDETRNLTHEFNWAAIEEWINRLADNTTNVNNSRLLAATDTVNDDDNILLLALNSTTLNLDLPDPVSFPNRELFFRVVGFNSQINFSSFDVVFQRNEAGTLVMQPTIYGGQDLVNLNWIRIRSIDDSGSWRWFVVSYGRTMYEIQ